VEHLYPVVGRERSLRELTQLLYFDVRTHADVLVGAIHVTCADEAEAECAEAFQQGFVQYLLPQLKFARRAAMRVSNLGGRYEWGSIGIADLHFTLPEAVVPGPRLMVIKINAHVALEEVERLDRTAAAGRGDRGRLTAPGSGPATPAAAAVAPAPEAPVVRDGERGFRLGEWKRYGRPSPCCSALDSLLRGGHEPWVEELRETFESEGKDRIALLMDPAVVDPAYRPLHTAIVSARLQARKAVLDIQELRAGTPIRFLVLPCVTINRHERDTEILCGVYTIDPASAEQPTTYFGLGDDPAAYETRVQNRQIQIADPALGTMRVGRDHRALVRSEFHLHGARGRIRTDDPRLERIKADVARDQHRHHLHARALLKASLPILAEVMPVPAAIILFAEGAAGIHHAFRAHRLARELEGSEDARKILAEVHDRIDQLDPAKAEALIELLMREYQR
jgi:hypothetical protein